MIGTGELTTRAIPRDSKVRTSELLWRSARFLTLVLAGMVALFSYRYVAGIPPVPDGIAANAFRMPWLAIHAGSASTALLLGALQFTAVPQWGGPSAHRIAGRFYVLSCLVGAVSGFVLALGSSYGPLATLGFGLLALAWGITNVLGWRCALSGHFAEHRCWMILSWALTLSAVTLRLYLPLAEIAGLPERGAYQAISFLCWVPNLILAQLLLRTKLSRLLHR